MQEVYLSFRIKSLCPRRMIEMNFSGIPLNVIYRDELVILRRINKVSHFQVKNDVCTIHFAVSENNIAFVI